MKKTTLMFATLFAVNAANAQTFIKGGQFVDYILPIQGSVTSTENDWGIVKPRWTDNGIEDDIYSYWGGNVIKGDDNKYHIFVAGWPEDSEKGHDTWLSGSRCYHGVGDTPYGPFVWHEELGAGHNTEAYRLQDGRTVVYNIELRYVSNETTLTTGTTWTLGKFKWDKRNRRLSRGVDPQVSLSNCTFSRRSDGSFLMMDRGGCVWVSKDGVDTYHQQTDHTAYVGNRTRYLEDPVIWRDHMQYYMIVNDYDARVANLNRSIDGVHWVNEPGVAYQTGVVKHEDGTIEDWYKLERPKIQTDETGRATYINWAVVDVVKDDDLGNDNHSSKNVIAPLVKSKLLEVVGTEVITESTTSIRVKIKAEEDFNPQTDVNLSSLIFGSYDKVNYGNGFRATASENSGNDLIVTFSGNAGESGITLKEFAPKMIGETNNGQILYGYAKLPYVNYEPAIVSAMIPKINEENFISRVQIDNYGLSTSEVMQVKVLKTDGTVLSTGEVPAIGKYESKQVELIGKVKPSVEMEQVVIAFYKDGVEIDRNTIYTDSIRIYQEELVNLITKAESLLVEAKYSDGHDALQNALAEAKAKLTFFDADLQKQLGAGMETAIRNFLYTNGITTQSWDFYTWALNNASFIMTDETVTASDGHQLKIAGSMTTGANSQEFYGRIAFDQGSGWLNFRNNGEGMNNTGLFNFNNDSHFSVIDLMPGDEVTFTFAGSTMPTFVSENAYIKEDKTKTLLAKGTKLVSETTYVVTGNEGEKVQLDILTYHYSNITSLLVETSNQETVTQPTITVETTDKTGFSITILPGKSSAGTAISEIYYTTDGTIPSQTNGTLYTVPFDCSKGTLVRAICYLPNGVASKVANTRINVPEQVWDLTNGTTWSADKLTAGKMYDTTGHEVDAGGLTITFDSDGAVLTSGKGLYFKKDGTETQPAVNYLQITVPAGITLTIENNAWNSTRSFYYTIDGIAGTPAEKSFYNLPSFSYKNESDKAQIFTFWAKGTDKNGTPQLFISKVSLKDESSIFTYSYTVTAKYGNVILDSWTGDGIQEFSSFSIPAKAYLQKDGKYYIPDDEKYPNTASGGYGYATTMGVEDITIDINYVEYTEGEIVFFTEAESLENSTPTTSASCSGGMKAHVNSNNKSLLVTLPTGDYSIYVGMVDDRDVYLRNDADDNTTNTILYFSKGLSEAKKFTLEKSTSLYLSGYTTSNGGLNQAGAIDYILIKKEEVSGITEFIEQKETKNIIYNLNGQQVLKPHRGIYIINGKKIVID